MKKKIITYSTIALFISTIVVWAASDDCPDGKTRVTIANPAGKVIEICVPDQVIDKIGGNGDVVIPATCPCFSQEDVEFYLSENTEIQCMLLEGVTFGGEYCDAVVCADAPFDPCYAGEYAPIMAVSCPGCDAYDWCNICEGSYLFCPRSKFPSCDPNPGEMTQLEAAACVAILKTFVE